MTAHYRKMGFMVLYFVTVQKMNDLDASKLTSKWSHFPNI